MDAIYCELRRIVSPSLKVHALEYAKYLYIDNAVHFAQLTPMRRAVEELLPIIQTEGPHNLVRKSAASALTALYVTSKGTFIRVLSHHLSPSDCESIVDELQLAFRTSDRSVVVLWLDRSRFRTQCRLCDARLLTF
ncbi:hypothetical protein DPX39_110120100 [Trypanosoma brucei equiperdum]|uniref:CLASP N terminal n=1 Tax=Trypanosoma brucei equiperdum TaxID=630700 RepID=A0A3L6KUX0_9TRYP|nr:hypothetical protein DPX39_110120100 [Trypanosoma brucei equiperdum]